MEDQGVDRNKLSSQDAGDDFLSSEVLAGGRSERLAPAPRSVPKSVIMRLATAKFRGISAGLAFFGGFCFLWSEIVFAIADPEVPIEATLGRWLLVAGLVFWFVAGFVLYRRVRSTVNLLSRGQLRTGRITHVYGQSSHIESYEKTVDGFRGFSGSSSGTGLGWMMRGALQDSRVKILLEDSGDVINTRLDLGARLVGQQEDPELQCLVCGHPGNQKVVPVEQFPWLSVSADGELEYRVRRVARGFGLRKAMARSFLVVVLTYALAVVGVSFNAKPLPGGVGEIPALGVAFIVLLLTFTHGVAPVFFYSFFVRVISGNSAQKYDPLSLLLKGFLYLHVGFWYGVPIFMLADLTSWLSPVWLVVDVLFSGHGRRSWAFFQHGSTSLALVLFLVCFSGANLFPMGLLVVLLQAVLLTFMDWKGKHLWVKEGVSER